jgi:hypothetical protein
MRLHAPEDFPQTTRAFHQRYSAVQIVHIGIACDTPQRLSFLKLDEKAYLSKKTALWQFFIFLIFFLLGVLYTYPKVFYRPKQTSQHEEK